MVLLQSGIVASPWAWAAAVTILCAMAVWSRRHKRPSVPVVLENQFPDRRQRALQYFHHPREVLNKGYRQFGDRIWGIETGTGVKLVLPLQYLDELKSHPSLSFVESINHDALLRWTGVGGLADAPLQLFKAKFNPTIAAYVPILHEIIARELPLSFPAGEDWTETGVYDRMLHLVSIISTRAFYGATASRDEAWLKLAQDYVSTVLEFIQTLKQWPSITWPVVRFFLPQRALLVQQWNRARSHLGATLEAKAQGRVPDDPPTLFDHIAAARSVDIDSLLQTQMALVVAGIHTTAAALTQFLYDLAARPEDALELREEVLKVHSQAGGVWTKQALGELKKLDSYMKESQRLSSADLSTSSPIHLSVTPLTSLKQPSKGDPPHL